MWMSFRYFEINNKTHFLYVFGYLFLANSKKLKFKQLDLLSVYYCKQYIVDSSWMMGVPLMDPK